MVQMSAVYTGDKHCEVTHGPSEAQISTDAPKDNHGRGEAFSPTDLMSTSLGVCMLTVMGIQADQKGWDMTGAKARSHLEKTALNCPVKLSLHPDVLLDIRFTYL